MENINAVIIVRQNIFEVVEIGDIVTPIEIDSVRDNILACDVTYQISLPKNAIVEKRKLSNWKTYIIATFTYNDDIITIGYGFKLGRLNPELRIIHVINMSNEIGKE